MTRKQARSVALRAETLALDTADNSASTIVALGDSIVYGWGMDYDQSFPCVLERRLCQDEPDAKQKRVINAGIPGDTSVMGCLRFAQDVSSWKPDTVLISFGLNDAMLRRTRFDAQREQIWRAQSNVLQRLPYLLKHWGPTSAREQTLTDVDHLDVPRVSEQVFARALCELISLSRDQDAVPHLITLVPALPCAVEKRQQALWTRYDRIVRQVAAQTGVRCVDLGDLSQACGERAYAADGLHLTAVGQNWIAEQLYHHLQEGTS